MSTSQNSQILRHLKAGKSITPLEALRRYGCFRLGARIWELKQSGHPIDKTWDDDGRKRWAKYRMAK